MNIPSDNWAQMLKYRRIFANLDVDVNFYNLLVLLSGIILIFLWLLKNTVFAAVFGSSCGISRHILIIQSDLQ